MIKDKGEKNESSCSDQENSSVKSSFPPRSLPTHTRGHKVPGCRESLTVVAVIEKKETPLAPIYSHKTKPDFMDIKSVYIEGIKTQELLWQAGTRLMPGLK